MLPKEWYPYVDKLERENDELQRKYEELEARVDKALKHLPERPGMAMGFLLEGDDG